MEARSKMKHSENTPDLVTKKSSNESLYIGQFIEWQNLIPWLQWLDELVDKASKRIPQVYGIEATQDAFRGLHISQEEFQRLVAREPGSSLFAVADQIDSDYHLNKLPLPEQLYQLLQSFSLSRFDICILIIALAPELDLKYERLYAYLQDDVSKKRPSVDLALNLLCPSALEKMQRRRHFATDASLIANELVHLIADTNQSQPPLLAHYLKLDDQIVSFILNEQSIDKRIVSACNLTFPAGNLRSNAIINDAEKDLPALAKKRIEAGKPLWLYFQGLDTTSKTALAENLASQLSMPILQVDLARLLNAAADFKTACRLTLREARLKGAILYLNEYDTLRESEHAAAHQQFLTQLAQMNGIMILSGIGPWIPHEQGPKGILSVTFDLPDFSQRLKIWKNTLKTQGIKLSKKDVESLARRFRFTPSQITDVVITATNRAQLQTFNSSESNQSRTLLYGLFAAARIQTRHILAKLAQHIEPKSQLDDLVLPEDAMTQLKEIIVQYLHRETVLETWGFGRKLSYGKGINVLFAGSSGTGKTMAAEILASQLGLDLFRIDLSGVVSKYIGETEKNLDKIYTAAENANAILFFDEADALFGKRSEVKDSHDRYANLEISYLLQKMEQYEGIAILATNLRQNLDEAFVRRLAFIVHFPFPDEAMRRRIWAGIWPASVPLAEDVDLDTLAKQFKLSGGNIRNIALSAAYLAAGNGQGVTRAQIQQAAQREFQKLGKLLAQTGEGLSRVPI
ncbi:MAG TPA: AAA family ATPase [Nitrosomonas sp.]|nr:AAA family ATPase [Nitrosomonas sp.]